MTTRNDVSDTERFESAEGVINELFSTPEGREMRLDSFLQ